MENLILLPDVEAVRAFVHESDASNETVLVSKEGYNLIIDGSSILGMMSVIGSKLKVRYYGESLGMRGLLEQYAC